MSVSTTQRTSALASFDQSSAIERRNIFPNCPREILRLILSMTSHPLQAQAVSSVFRDTMNEVSQNFLFVTFDSPFRSQNPHFFNETDPKLSDEQRAEYKERNDRIAESFKKHALLLRPYSTHSSTALATFFLEEEMAHHYMVNATLFPTHTLSLNPESYLSLVKTNELAFFFANLENLNLQGHWFNDEALLYLFLIYPIIDSMSHALHLSHREILESHASATDPLARTLINVDGVLENITRFQNTLFRLTIRGNPQFATLLESEYTHSLQTVIEKFLTVLIPIPLLLQSIPPEAYHDISAFLHFMSDPQPEDLETFIDRLRHPPLQALGPFLSNPRNRESLLNSFLSLIAQNVISMFEHDPSPEIHSLLEELKKSFSPEELRRSSLLISRPSIPQEKFNETTLQFISDLTRELQSPRDGIPKILSILSSAFMIFFRDSFDSEHNLSILFSLKDFLIHALKLVPPNGNLEYQNTHSLPVSQYTLEAFPETRHYLTRQDDFRIRVFRGFPFSKTTLPPFPRIPTLLNPKMPYFWKLQTLSLAGQRIVPSTFDQFPPNIRIVDLSSLTRSTLDQSLENPALVQLRRRTSRINLFREEYFIPAMNHLAPGRHPHLWGLAQICAIVYAETHLDLVAQHPFLYSGTSAGLDWMRLASLSHSLTTLANQSVFSYAISSTSTHPQWRYPIASGLHTVSSTISDGLIRGFTLRKILGSALAGTIRLGMRPALSLSSKEIHLAAKKIFHFFGK